MSRTLFKASTFVTSTKEWDWPSINAVRKLGLLFHCRSLTKWDPFESSTGRWMVFWQIFLVHGSELVIVRRRLKLCRNMLSDFKCSSWKNGWDYVAIMFYVLVLLWSKWQLNLTHAVSKGHSCTDKRESISNLTKIKLEHHPSDFNVFLQNHLYWPFYRLYSKNC